MIINRLLTTGISLFLVGMACAGPAAISTLAADFPVSDQDQGNIIFLCETAARSPNITIEQVAAAAQFCVQWKARMKASNEKPKE